MSLKDQQAGEQAFTPQKGARWRVPSQSGQVVDSRVKAGCLPIQGAGASCEGQGVWRSPWAALPTENRHPEGTDTHRGWAPTGDGHGTQQGSPTGLR